MRRELAIMINGLVEEAAAAAEIISFTFRLASQTLS